MSIPAAYYCECVFAFLSCLSCLAPTSGILKVPTYQPIMMPGQASPDERQIFLEIQMQLFKSASKGQLLVSEESFINSLKSCI